MHTEREEGETMRERGKTTVIYSTFRKRWTVIKGDIHSYWNGAEERINRMRERVIKNLSENKNML